MWIIPPPPAALIKNNKYTTVFLPPFFGERIIVSMSIFRKISIFSKDFPPKFQVFFIIHKIIVTLDISFLFFFLIFLPSSQLKLDKTWLKTEQTFFYVKGEREGIFCFYISWILLHTVTVLVLKIQCTVEILKTRISLEGTALQTIIFYRGIIL